MLRLLLLSLSTGPILIGFALPFYLPTLPGYLGAAALILLGAGLTWWVEAATEQRLDADTRLNRLLNIDDGQSDKHN